MQSRLQISLSSNCRKKTVQSFRETKIIKDVTYEWRCWGVESQFLQFCSFDSKETKKGNMLHKLCHLESFSRFDLRNAQRKSRSLQLWKSPLCIYTKRGQSRIVRQCGEICFHIYFFHKDQNRLKQSFEINGKKKAKNNRVCLWPAVDTSPHNDAMFWSDKHKGLSIQID